MSQPTNNQPEMPNASGVILRVLIALVIGLVIVFCVVLPAEYRIDPTGVGRLTGLLDLTTPRVTQTSAEAKSADNKIDPAVDAAKDAAAKTDSKVDAKGDPIPVLVKVGPQILRSYPDTFKTETIKITLKPDGELEYKVRMKAGATLVYSWQTDQGNVYYDFHGEPADPKKSQSYMEVQETSNAHGSLVAPFEGIHGWFWLNLTSKPMVITLKISGFYESHGLVK
ncbi:MAG: hypothetical protein ABI824_04845 [Acidobacteriota bacterium]